MIKSVKNPVSDLFAFLMLPPKRNKVLKNGADTPLPQTYSVNRLADHLHPKVQLLPIIEIVEHKWAKTFVFGGDSAPFRAGQYVSINLKIGDANLTRPYSISSGPKQGTAITVKRDENGFASPWILDNWKVGDIISMSAPEGTFCYEPMRDEKNVIGIAGGSGITPFLSMARAIRDGIEDFNLTILFGNRTEEDILFKSEFDEICAATNRVKVVHVLSDEQREGYVQGFITADVIKKYAGKAYSVFLCGPSAMYRFVDQELNKLGLDRKYIRHELFGAPKSPVGMAGYTGNPEAVYSLTVHTTSATRVVPMKACEPVLVAVERAGIEAPSRCRGGECGWCRTRLIQGIYFVPEHMEYRRAADKKHNYIHLCSTFPLGDMEIEAKI